MILPFHAIRWLDGQRPDAVWHGARWQDNRRRHGVVGSGSRGSSTVQGGIMRTKWIVGSLTVSVALGGLVAVGPMDAEAKSKQVDQITCEEFLALNPDDQQRIAYWVDGYQVAKGEAAVGTVAFDKFGQPIGALIDDCKA